MNIFLNVNGETHSYPMENVKLMLHNGMIKPTDLGCLEGQKQWLPLTRFPELQIQSSRSISTPGSQRKVSLLLGLGILLIPFVFSWFTLRRGYSLTARGISFLWFALIFVSLVLAIIKPVNTNQSKDVIANQSVFPASEVCKYSENSLLKKFGTLGGTWEKFKNIDGYGCEPYPSTVEIIRDNTLSKKPLEKALFEPTSEITVKFFADGDTNHGADYIIARWEALNTSDSSEQTARIQYFLPFVEHITDKALRSPIPEKIKANLANNKEFPATANNKSFCERSGNGYLCFKGVKGDQNPQNKFRQIRIIIFPNDLAYTKYMEKNNEV